MTIIPNKDEKDNAISKCCENFIKFIKWFKVNKLLRKVGAIKEKGVPGV